MRGRTRIRCQIPGAVCVLFVRAARAYRAARPRSIPPPQALRASRATSVECEPLKDSFGGDFRTTANDSFLRSPRRRRVTRFRGAKARDQLLVRLLRRSCGCEYGTGAGAAGRLAGPRPGCRHGHPAFARPAPRSGGLARRARDTPPGTGSFPLATGSLRSRASLTSASPRACAQTPASRRGQLFASMRRAPGSVAARITLATTPPKAGRSLNQPHRRCK
jgi:hypothetical protein